MMKFVLASRNRHKIDELISIMSEYISEDFEILSLDDIGYTGEIIENGASFEENALIKASLPASLGYFGIADDSGLTVDALGGAPGIYSARYAGEPTDNKANNQKLLAALSNVPDKDRGASFVCTIAIVAPDMRRFTVTGKCKGYITREPRGQNGFGYDPLFFCPEQNKTFAELDQKVKNKISHRANAIKKFALLLPDFMKNYINP